MLAFVCSFLVLRFLEQFAGGTAQTSFASSSCNCNCGHSFGSSSVFGVVSRLAAAGKIHAAHKQQNLCCRSDHFDAVRRIEKAEKIDRWKRRRPEEEKEMKKKDDGEILCLF
jgi:hypothetical protein